MDPELDRLFDAMGCAETAWHDHRRSWWSGPLDGVSPQADSYTGEWVARETELRTSMDAAISAWESYVRQPLRYGT